MLLSFSAAPTSARWHRRPSRRNVPKSCPPGPGPGLPWMAPRGLVPLPPRAELGLGPTDGTRGGHATGPATRSLPAGPQGGCGFNWSLYQHSSAPSPAWGGPPPTPPGRTTPGKMLAGREATAGGMGEIEIRARSERLPKDRFIKTAASAPLQGPETSTAPY